MRAARLYWPAWALATVTTGVVAGLFLGYALLLGPFLDWLLASGKARVLAETYPVFRRGAGGPGFQLFYAVASLQVLAGLAFAAVTLAARRGRVVGLVAGAVAVLWPLVHYATGFGAVEAAVLRSTMEAPPALAEVFVAWNQRVHLAHASVLGVAFGALLVLPFFRR